MLIFVTKRMVSSKYSVTQTDKLDCNGVVAERWLCWRVAEGLCEDVEPTEGPRSCVEAPPCCLLMQMTPLNKQQRQVCSTTASLSTQTTDVEGLHCGYQHASVDCDCVREVFFPTCVCVLTSCSGVYVHVLEQRPHAPEQCCKCFHAAAVVLFVCPNISQ